MRRNSTYKTKVVYRVTGGYVDNKGTFWSFARLEQWKKAREGREVVKVGT